ncbi:MAG: alanine racemase [Pirellulales bacterium]|nr:alanine racemase [Pirellulales bacterium]
MNRTTIAAEDHAGAHHAAAPLDYAAWRRLLADEPLPAAVVDLAAFDRNVALVADVLRSSGRQHALRLATKSVRVPWLIRRILDYGPPYRGLMCYAASEVGFLAEQGFDDFLLAYPTVQRTDLDVLRRVHESGRQVRLVLDGAASVERVAEAMAGVARPFPIVLDVDMSWRPLGGRLHLGVRRSPLRSVEDVQTVYEQAARLRGIEIVGLMGYEAQVAGLGDRNPFKRMLNPIAAEVRRRSMRAVAELRRRLAETLKHQGLKLELFNGGGTGSITYAVDEPWLTELTAGSGFLCSHLFDYYSNVRPEPAAFFALQVVRSSDPGYVTCQGGGYIASGEPGWDKVPRPHLPAGLALVSTEGCGEVQTPLRSANPTAADVSAGCQPGDPVLFRHAKAGELAEHFREYLIVDQGSIVERVPTYRGCGQCFL